MEVLLGLGQSALDTIRLRFKLEQSRELRLAPQPDDGRGNELPGDRLRGLLTEVGFDQGEWGKAMRPGVDVRPRRQSAYRTPAGRTLPFDRPNTAVLIEDNQA
jgi:hypothetical protein